MNFLRIKETCLYVHDLVKARVFYEQILGLAEISYLPDKHLFMRAGDSVLLLFNPEDSAKKSSPPAHYATGKQHFAFEVRDEDYSDFLELIKSYGIPVIDEVTWKSGKRSFYFNDPEGNVLEILPDKGVWD